jgi:serine protease AprX
VQCMQSGEKVESGKSRPVYCEPASLLDFFKEPYDLEARVHSNSWGRKCSKRQHDYDLDQRAPEIDHFVWENPEMVICFAAGNDGCNKDCDAQIGAAAAAKNCITVGASESDRPYPEKGDKSHVAKFSSRGPTKDGRIKPDVVAPGKWILSARSSHMSTLPAYPGDDQFWCYMKGTSMATPLVAGCTANLREALKSHGTAEPKAALVKALLVNGAEILADPMPNPDSGFGRVNLANSIKIVGGTNGAGFHEDKADDTKHNVNDLFFTRLISFDSKNTKLKATLVWSDPPGAGITNSLLLKIQNDSGSGGEEDADNNDQEEADNNVQQVLLEGSSDGKATITVKFLSLTKSPQPFFVVWRFC